jgi:hypothetical protein
MNQPKYHLSNTELIKKTVSLSAALSGVVGVNYPRFLIPAIYYINSYVFLDLFFAKRDMIVHHLLVLSFFSAIKLHSFPVEYELDFTKQLMRFEYSTLFYSAGPLLLHYLSQQNRRDVSKWIPIIRNALHVGFGITFFKFRIYDYSRNIVFRSITYSSNKFPSIVAFVHLISTTWVFYALNLYWLQLIIWKLVPSRK